MHEKELKLYLDRARCLLRRSKEELFTETIVLAAEYCRTELPVPYAERLKLNYRPAEEGIRWGNPWDSAWFHLTGAVPAAWRGKEVALQLDFSGEALLFDAAGVPYCAVTNESVFTERFSKDTVRFLCPAEGGEAVDLWVEAAANALFGIKMNIDPDRRCPKPYGDYQPVVNRLRLGVFDAELWRFRLDLQVLLSLAEALDPKDYRVGRLVAGMNAAAAAYAGNPANAAAAREALRPLLALPALGSAMTATAVGHAHIDIGWLWPVRESIRKTARTFANQLRNLEEYPAYVFGASQAQLYAFARDHYPELYEQVKARIKEGRWEIQGGMWVEADCNLISGESMVRQFLCGKNFFMDEFGVEVKNLWIPDVFGYAASMPQIIRLAGCDFFLTQKISWNQFNAFPYHTFHWRGIDGTRVLTHFPPENTYNTQLLPAEMVPGQNRLAEGAFQDEFITLFGIGDGGGGPTSEYIERGLRLADLEGNPKVKFGRADRFFASVEEKYSDRLPEWVGELYLEFHRGTLTSQARTKRNNRKLEQLLSTVEFIGGCLPPAAYPGKELDGIWKKLLLNQFHDIIPGSSIRLVYEVTEREHAECFAACEALLEAAAERLFRREARSMVLVNTLSCDFTGAVALPEAWRGFEVLDPDGRRLPVQAEADGLLALVTAPASSFFALARGAKLPEEAGPAPEAGLVLENERIRYEFAPDGRLTAAFDKEAGRPVLAGDGNVLSLYGDYPNSYEAWDIDLFYREEFIESARGVGAAKVAAGPVRQVLKFKLAIGGSRLEQTVSLAAGAKRLDFETRVEWLEERKMLRVAFPAAVFATEAAFDIQYGYVKRATHANTSWDLAKFEVAGQRYADLSEPAYGVALLNDCKYGYRVADATLDLCLLRSPRYPDWDADRGEHVFTYSLYPHTGDLAGSDVIDQAAQLNRPPRLFPGRSGTANVPCRLESRHIRLEVLKKAEKSDDLVIRLVETAGRSSAGVLHLNGDFRVTGTNLMEWTDEGEYPVAAGRVELVLKPFQILTLKLHRS